MAATSTSSKSFFLFIILYLEDSGHYPLHQTLAQICPNTTPKIRRKMTKIYKEKKLQLWCVVSFDGQCDSEKKIEEVHQAATENSFFSEHSKKSPPAIPHKPVRANKNKF